MTVVRLDIKVSDRGDTGCSLNYCVFSLKFCDFSELVFYLPGVCTHTDTEGKHRKYRVRNILKYPKKNTIFNEHPVGSVLLINALKFTVSERLIQNLI